MTGNTGTAYDAAFRWASHCDARAHCVGGGGAGLLRRFARDGQAPFLENETRRAHRKPPQPARRVVLLHRLSA